MFKKFVTYIEQEPWDEAMVRQEKWLNRVSVLAIILAVLYFSPVIIHILTR